MRKISFTIITLILIYGCQTDIQEYYTESLSIEKKVFDDFQEELLNESRRMLTLEPISVVHKPEVSTDMDSRNYISMACYWWPDPDSDDQLPYIRKDGHVNPETRSNKSDLPKMIEMAKSVERLAISYDLSLDEAFAEKAIELLDYWFLNEQTAMLPHLEYAQMVKGLNSGRSYGIIDTWWLVRVIESIDLLKNSNHWTTDLERDLKKWFADYTDWLYHGDFGREEVRSKNNHGTWYDVQIVSFGYFSGNEHLAKRHLEEVSLHRIPRQIGYFGKQSLETRRPWPVHYSIYNLSGLIKLAEYGELLNVDIKNEKAFYSGNIENATHYLIDMVRQSDLSGIRDSIDLTDTEVMYLDLLAGAWRLYGNTGFLTELSRVYDDIDNAELSVFKNREIWENNERL
ncbi:MAG: alginate lyase family protein [Balneolales bacterium]